MPSDSGPDLISSLQKLEIPPDFARYENVTEASTILDLERWKQNVASALNELLVIVQSKEAAGLTLRDQGNILFATLPFASECPWDSVDESGHIVHQEDWVTLEPQRLAKTLLALPPFCDPSQELVTQILKQNLKPIFKSSPHPHVHSATGRKLAKPAGGSMAMQDYYEGQRWKQYPGVASVVLWCVREIETDAYENMWHLIIPPVMTLLDDYEAKYKLQGVKVVQGMLRCIPRGLLNKTGVDGLLRQSLRTALSHLQSPETPELLRSAIGASIDLTLLTTSIGPGIKPSSERFDQLSSLLGEGIISGIWLYAEDKPAVIKATFDALPSLLKALGIGTTRFLQALIPQLTHPLIPRPLVDRDSEMQLSSLRVLETILDVCKPRIQSWKETVLDAIGRCWIGLLDEEQKEMNVDSDERTKEVYARIEVKKGLQCLCAKLANVCPSVVQDEIPRFLEADKNLFQGLFADIPL